MQNGPLSCYGRVLQRLRMGKHSNDSSLPASDFCLRVIFENIFFYKMAWLRFYKNLLLVYNLMNYFITFSP